MPAPRGACDPHLRHPARSGAGPHPGTTPATAGSAEEAARRLAAIPGIGPRAARVVVAEAGTEMSRFATAGHLAWWAGMGPVNDVGAGVRRSGRTTTVSRWPRAASVRAAFV